MNKIILAAALVAVSAFTAFAEETKTEGQNDAQQPVVVEDEAAKNKEEKK